MKLEQHIRDRTPVPVPEAVYAAIMAVRKSGRTNMLDVAGVMEVLVETDLTGALWVRGHLKRYVALNTGTRATEALKAARAVGTPIA